MLLHVLLEPAAEGGDVLHRHAQSGSVRVSAEIGEQVGTALNGLVYVEARHTACRARCHAVVALGQHHAWLVEDLGQARGHDADDAAVPLLVEEDDGLVLVPVFQGHDDAVGLLCHGLVQVLALFVVFVDAFRMLAGCAVVLLDEQCHGFSAGLHAPGGIDARSYLEDDVAQGNLLVLQSAHFHECLDAHAGRTVQLAQAVIGQDAVLAHDGHDVGRDADGAEVEQGDELRELDAVADGEGLHQLEAHAATAQMLVGIGVVGTLCVEDGYGGGQLVARHVVADDEVDAFLLGVGYLVGSLDAAVEHDDEADARLAGIVDALPRDAVAVFVAVGDVVVDVAVELLQEAVDQCHGGASVHVVVAIDEDAFLAAQGFVQSAHGLLHVLEEERVVQVC